ncbi:MAG TPA: coenzyme F420-0:L-glutamate ligase [Candidatus Dormibacteraeota bacterium]
MEVLAVAGLPEVRPGDDLAALIAAAATLEPGDVVVVAQKVVSKAEGRLRDLREVTPSDRALELAAKLDADARMLQVVLDESVRVVRDERVLIVETAHGFVCANAGVDHSNIETPHTVTLLPLDPDASAAALSERLGVPVIVSDTFGRPWRLGIVNVALGVAGLPGVVDLRGGRDDFGRALTATVVAVADELAAAAGLVMGKTSRVPVVVIRGYAAEGPAGTGADLIRPPEEDLFR